MSHSDTLAAMKFVRFARRGLLVDVQKHCNEMSNKGCISNRFDSAQLGQLITAELNNRDVIFGLK